jgi:predicted lipoprotein with Yx(FWY)xxD motif
MKRLTVLIAVSVAALAAAAMALASSTATVTIAHTKLGTVLVSSNGHALYLLQGDSGAHFECTGACLGYWPPLMATGKITVAGGAKASLAGTVKRGSGKQVTYKGHPLYWFYKDNKAGQTNGQGVETNNKYWWAVSSSGAAVTGAAKSSSGGGQGSSSSSSGGGSSPGW